MIRVPNSQKVNAKDWLYGFLRRSGNCSSLKEHELKAMLAGLNWLWSEIQTTRFTPEPTVEVDDLSRLAEERIHKDEHLGVRVGQRLIQACIGPVFNSSFAVGVPDKEKALVFIAEIRAEVSRRLNKLESAE